MQAEQLKARTVTVSSKRQITIPVSFDSVKEGDTLLLIQKGEDIFVKPLEEIFEAMYPALMTEEALAEGWNSSEDEVAFAHLQNE